MINITKYLHLVTEYGIKIFCGSIALIVLIILLKKLRNHWRR